MWNTTSITQVGFKSDQNFKHRRTMEDRHVILDAFGDVKSSGYFAVYDGHAGTSVAEYLSKNLHQVSTYN
jgi:serine/threonine protein phosphatase PrpC